MKYIVMCDHCGEQFRYKHNEEKQDEGWIEVWTDDDEALDFCTRECCALYFDPSKEEKD